MGIKDYAVRLFYKKPQSLGEGLSRVKNHFGAGGCRNLSSTPGVRYYNKFNILTETPLAPEGVNISRLVLDKPGKVGTINVDYASLNFGKTNIHTRTVSEIKDFKRENPLKSFFKEIIA